MGVGVGVGGELGLEGGELEGKALVLELEGVELGVGVLALGG